MERLVAGVVRPTSLVADIASEPTGVIQQVGDKARFGLMEFNGSSNGSNGGKVLADVGSGLTPMVNAIQSTPASTWTPLAESLYEATRYFVQIKPAYSPIQIIPILLRIKTRTITPLHGQKLLSMSNAVKASS